MTAEPVAFDESTVDPLAAMADQHENVPNAHLNRIALMSGGSFLVCGSNGDIAGFGDGFFSSDTRLLSRLVFGLGGRRPVLLGSAISGDAVLFEANLTNAAATLDDGTRLPQGSIHVNRTRFLWDSRLFERIALTNYSLSHIRPVLSFRLAADFRDIFEVRGMVRSRRGRMMPAETDSRHVGFQYEGLDKERRSLWLSLSHPMTSSARADEITIPIHLPRSARRVLYIEAGATRGTPGRARHRKMQAAAHRAMKRKRQRGAQIHSSGPLFNDWVGRTRADIALLSSELETGPYPFAGIPWFSTAFGRDGILTALSLLWLDPGLARGVLGFLASTQATVTDPFADAEPGKILHEIRGGEVARLNEVPFGRYYGGVDTTPLFVHLAAEYARRTADDAFIDRLWPALCKAVAWIEARRAGDPNRLVTYDRACPTGLRNQGWKDSADAVFHADGTLAEGPISLVEVQGYAYLALNGMAEMARRRGETLYATQLQDSAGRLQKSVEDLFWMPDRQFYALALDGRSRQCAVRTTNAGQLLYSGLPAPDRGRLVARALLEPDFLTGWGLRTVATTEARYNPMSYHNGSVWPHDTAICTAGIVRYAQSETAARALGRLFEASFHFGKSLPELFCGFARRPGEGPVAYPVACQPQAWAAGSVFLLLQTALGLQIDAYAREVRVIDPLLPAGLDQLDLRQVAIGGAKASLSFIRKEDRVTCTIRHDGRPAPRMLVHHIE
ncbi:amylo-alpha-1,6-glucosidase [Frigidibacter sp. SD6-1]|uniref:amylo-alpha-1,6-glucosidase n=1 Tax=Frigidibacter sp. SD6-1 TaxID=3032581 RepID=UPI0024DFDADA|nr:amylo-alpha-1,6-glucosidase [Frigidibacter sp. SD6-1]